MLKLNEKSDLAVPKPHACGPISNPGDLVGRTVLVNGFNPDLGAICSHKVGCVLACGSSCWVCGRRGRCACASLLVGRWAPGDGGATLIHASQ